ncbi:MAG: hypothetical protein COA45_11540 [Zetaproteobacteria bacterium]|nr:MAG: hypothetical protein COA45_11540 [Zetaproteobacteria bacterium]
MTEEAQTEEDPSIEEILDSIRQIISEDDGDSDQQDVAPEPEVESEPEPVSDEPLDQSAIDDIDFDTPSAETEPEPVSDEPLDQSAIDDIDFDTPSAETEPEADDADDILELTERVDEELEPDPEPTPEPEPVVPPVVDDSLLTQSAEEAAFDAISELARKTAVEHSGITLEDIVRSELKPLLRTWLDKNLPVVIERLVREELERVSKRVLDE